MTSAAEQLDITAPRPPIRRETRGFAAIGLFAPKSNVNVGSALRAAQCYGAALVVATGSRYHRASTDTMAGYRHVPFQQTLDLFEHIPYDCVPVAVDLIDGARDLTNYVHPPRAFYIFGPEDGSLGRQVTKRCRDTVFVPTAYCMNLAATVNVVLYDRMLKSRHV